MKVGKPILIALVLAILFAGYTLFFTGQKQVASGPSTAANPKEANPAGAHAVSAVQTQKPDLSAMHLAWRDDPFLLPKPVTDKKTQKPKVEAKLTAIMEGRSGRYAIVGSEIVKKGDMVGDEKVADIGSNAVVLVRDRARRTLSMEDSAQ